MPPGLAVLLVWSSDRRHIVGSKHLEGVPFLPEWHAPFSY
jgi:hypothetical protein